MKNKPNNSCLNKHFLSHRASQSQEIGDYILKQTIGEGSFSKVKLAIHKPSNNIVAIKILDKDKLSKNDQKRTIREMDILQSLNHPNIIQVITILENLNSYFIVMEYCAEGELFNYIVHKKRLTEEEASFIFYQIINGLDYIHSQNISHRDLKPENILLLSNRMIKIIDFGLSNIYSDNNTLTTPCGSPCYAAPEMLVNRAYDGKAVDIWSTGIILFAMICGYLPFEDKNNQRLFQKILKSKIIYPRCVSTLAKGIITKMLIKDPKKRITIDEIKRHPFYLQGRNIYNIKFNSTYDDLNTCQSGSTTIPASSRGSNHYYKNKINDDSSCFDEDFDIETDLYEREAMRTIEPREPPVSKLINYTAIKTQAEEDKLIKVNLRYPSKPKNTFKFKSPLKIKDNPNIGLLNYSMFKHKISLTKRLNTSLDKRNNMTIYSYRRKEVNPTNEPSFQERCITSIDEEKRKGLLNRGYVSKFQTTLATRRRKMNQSIDHDNIIEKFYKKYNLRINYPVFTNINNYYINQTSEKKKKKLITYQKKETSVVKRNSGICHRKTNTVMNISSARTDNKNNKYIKTVISNIKNNFSLKRKTNSNCIVIERVHTQTNQKNKVIKIR